MTTYLGILEAEANSPSAREVATALEDLAQHAYQFARDLFTLNIRIDRGERTPQHGERGSGGHPRKHFDQAREPVSSGCYHAR
jgi:hypothetical protein